MCDHRTMHKGSVTRMSIKGDHTVCVCVCVCEATLHIRVAPCPRPLGSGRCLLSGERRSAAGASPTAAADWSSPDTPPRCSAPPLRIPEAGRAARRSRSECPGSRLRACGSRDGDGRDLRDAQGRTQRTASRSPAA